jgi:hypothetical protein
VSRNDIELHDGTPIAVGQRVIGVISGADRDCYPNWDDGGRCAQYSVDATQTDTLTVTLRPRSASPMELFVVPPTGDAIWAGSDLQQSLSMTAGLRLTIVVIAYRFPQAFELDTSP